jgi:hypothetical protein
MLLTDDRVFDMKAVVGMSGGRLDGRSILVVEDEPLIAIDIADALEKAGASVARELAAAGTI